MLHAGNAIDATLGVTFGLSTLAAAACGQLLDCNKNRSKYDNYKYNNHSDYKNHDHYDNYYTIIPITVAITVAHGCGMVRFTTLDLMLVWLCCFAKLLQASCEGSRCIFRCHFKLASVVPAHVSRIMSSATLEIPRERPLDG